MSTAATIAVTIASGGAARAQIDAVGLEFQVNTYTAGNQGGHSQYRDGGIDVATAPAGDFVVVWQDYDGLDGQASGIFARRYDSAGQALSAQFQVNAYTFDAQRSPRAAVTDDGGFVVVWESGGYHDGSGFGVFGQRYDSTGGALGSEFQVNASTAGTQSKPDVCALTGGGFAVVWQGYLASEDIFGRTYDGAGAPASSEFLINQYTTDFQWQPSIACDGSGRFVVVWQSQGQVAGLGYGVDVFGRHYDGDGTALGSEFLVNSYTSGEQETPSVAVHESGEFLVAWSAGGSTEDIFARRFAAAGAAVGTDFVVNTYTTGGQYLPSASADSEGGFVVAWTSDPPYGSAVSNDGNLRGCFAQRIGASGARLGSEFQVNTYTTGHQTGARSAADGDGGVLIAWTSGPKTEPSTGQDGDRYGVFAQRYTAQPVTIDPCGNPIDTEQGRITASDALAILQSVVGTFTCELCVCDVDNSGSIAATDALAVLREVVGLPAAFACAPCT